MPDIPVPALTATTSLDESIDDGRGDTNSINQPEVVQLPGDAKPIDRRGRDLKPGGFGGDGHRCSGYLSTPAPRLQMGDKIFATR